MSPADAHLARGMRDAAAAEIAGEIFYQTAPTIIVKPILQIMQAGEVVAGALAAAISILFDVIEHAFRRPVRFRFVQHSRETERDLEKRPAIHAVEIHRRRRVVPAGSKEFYFTGADLYRWHCANSFSEKEPAKHCSPTVTGRRASKTFHARPAASASGLAQAQFSYQRSHPFAFREAVGWPCGTAIPESSRRRDLHYLDRSRLISDSNSRGQYSDRPDLVEMA